MAYYEVNTSANRIEIYFSSKPSVSIRDYMKSYGWRWHSYGKFWYHYNSATNKNVAEQVCAMANGIKQNSQSVSTKQATQSITKKTISKPSTPTTPPIPKRIVYSENEEVVFTLDGNKYFGEILIVYTDSALVFYPKSIINGDAEYDSVTIPFDKIEKSRYSRHTSIPSKGSVVTFESSNGYILKGLVTESTYFSGDIVAYSIESNGRISMIQEFDVSSHRILDVEYFSSIEDVVPLKSGDKVEYYNSEGKLQVGRVEEFTRDYEHIKVSYTEIDEWKDKYTWHDYVRIDGITKLSNLKKVLRREDYITPSSSDDIAYNEEIKARIKTKSDEFKESKHAVAKKPLFKHQLAGCLLAEKYDKFAFFYDTGTGKTVMALNIIESKFRETGARFLIIAPKSIIKTAWIDDASNFYPSMRILPLYKGFDVYKKRGLFRAWRTGKSRSTVENDKVFRAHIKLLSDVFGLKDPEQYSNVEIENILSNEAQHYIINSELFIANPHKYIDELGITGLVMDESAIMKNYDSKTAKTIREISPKLKYVYLLSGKPAPNNEIEFFSQMKVVAPEMFSFSYDRFLALFCTTQSRRNILNPANKDLFAEMVSAKSLIISKKDCLDLPDTVETVRLIDLPDEIMDDYNELYYECMVLIKGMDNSSLFYSTQSKMAVLMKLRQMASGFFMQKTDDGTESRIIIDIHKAKINEVKSIIDEIPDEQVIIWCQFQHEIELLEKELSKLDVTVTAYGKTKTLEENIDAFKNGRAKYIIAHPKTLKYGVTFTNCKYAIYYSFSYSAEDYDQSHDRNYRLGQTESCTYFFLQAADTIDEIMYDKVMNKLSNAEFFEQLVKDAAKHGIDYDSLKCATDEKIKAELHNQDGISSIQSEIVSRSEHRERERIKKALQIQFDSSATGIDFLDAIPGPTDEELFELECELRLEETRSKKYPLSWYIAHGNQALIYNDPLCPEWLEAYSDFPSDFYAADKIRSLINSIPITYHTGVEEAPMNFDRCLLYDGLKGDDDVVPVINFSDEPEELRMLLEDHPTTEMWIAEMYRRVFHALDELPEHISEMIRLRYGLNDGVFRTYSTIGDHIGYYFDEEADKYYTCNAARVSQGLSEGIQMLADGYKLEAFRNQVQTVLGIMK